jgi:hypothetical protein
MSRLPETRADGARTDAPYSDCEVEERPPSRSSKSAVNGPISHQPAAWMSKKHSSIKGMGFFSLFDDRRGIHRTGAHAQTARPAAFKKLQER